MSALFLPALCAAVLTAGLFARIDVYGAFVRGAKAGMETLLQMAPCLCAVLTLTALLLESLSADAAFAEIRRRWRRSAM